MRLFVFIIFVHCTFISLSQIEKQVDSTKDFSLRFKATAMASYFAGNREFGTFGFELFNERRINNSYRYNLELGVGYNRQLFVNDGYDPFNLIDVQSLRGFNFQMVCHNFEIPVRISREFIVLRSLNAILHVGMSPSLIFAGNVSYDRTKSEVVNGIEVVDTVNYTEKYNFNNKTSYYFSPKINFPISIAATLKYKKIQFGIEGRYYLFSYGKNFNCGGYNRPCSLKHHYFSVGIYTRFNILN